MTIARPTFCALLPMKGHSERVPGKNIRSIAGRPLCHWILETLSEVDAITRIVINTDSEEIARIASLDFDVEIHERPPEIQGDFVSMNRVLEYDLSLLPDEQYFIQTHSTNPLLRAETIAAALNQFNTADADLDSLFSVTRHQARFFAADGAPINHDPNILERTQDLPPIFEENSNFYIFSRQSFEATGQRVGRHPKLSEVPALEAIDIDAPSDWQLAETLLQQRILFTS